MQHTVTHTPSRIPHISSARIVTRAKKAGIHKIGAMAAVGVAAALERVGEGSMTFAGEVAAEARKAAEKDEPPPEILPGANKIRKFFGVDD